MKGWCLVTRMRRRSATSGRVCSSAWRSFSCVSPRPRSVRRTIPRSTPMLSVPASPAANSTSVNSPLAATRTAIRLRAAAWSDRSQISARPGSAAPPRGVRAPHPRNKQPVRAIPVDVPARLHPPISASQWGEPHHNRSGNPESDRPRHALILQHPGRDQVVRVLRPDRQGGPRCQDHVFARAGGLDRADRRQGPLGASDARKNPAVTSIPAAPRADPRKIPAPARAGPRT